MSSDLLDQEDYIEKAEKLVESIGIPAQPKIITDLNRVISNRVTDMSAISGIISKDVAMSAKILKLVNSPFFGLKEKVDSIDRALSMMGLGDFNRIIMASSLRETFGGKYSAIERFWDHSMITAAVAMYIAEKIKMESPEQAYTAGLFHDCGIPLLMKKFPDYGELVDFALGVVNSEALKGSAKSIVGIENERYATHHCAVGCIVAKSWNVSPVVHQSIWYHHYIHLDVHTNPSIKRMTAVLILADYISSCIMFSSGGSCPVESEADWSEMHAGILSELGLNVDDVKDFKEDLSDRFLENSE